MRDRYKLYLIDEVHMLSTAAFNALLKTLEEPPPRVVFVLATTDPQRVLPTIISRCQRFDFRRIPLVDLTAHLQEIARAEAIAITADAIDAIAQLADGGLRDAESLLDQLSLLPGEVDIERVWDLAGAVPEKELLALVRAARAGDAAATLTEVRQLLDRGREPLTLLQSLTGCFRDLLVARVAPERRDLASLTPAIWAQLCQEATAWEPDRILAVQKILKDSEVQLKNTAQPRLWLEVTLLTLGSTAPSPTATAAPAEVTAPHPNPDPHCHTGRFTSTPPARWRADASSGDCFAERADERRSPNAYPRGDSSGAFYSGSRTAQFTTLMATGPREVTAPLDKGPSSPALSLVGPRRCRRNRWRAQCQPLAPGKLEKS